MIAALSVSIEDPSDAELLRWIENQISDLPVDLTRDAKTASVAVTIEPILEGFVVSVADQRTGKIVVREVRAEEGGKDRRARRSALREAVALSVRGTLQALALRATEKRAREAHAAERPPEQEVSPPLEEAPPAPAESAAPLPFFVAIGWRAGAADDGFDLDQGLTARGGASLGSLELGAELSLGLPLALTDAATRIELARHRALLTLGLALFELGPARLFGALAAGASIAHRSASPRAEGVVVRAPSTEASPLFALDARLRLGRPFALELSLGAELLPAAPIFQYAQGGEPLERARLWTIQPKLGLAIFFSSP